MDAKGMCFPSVDPVGGGKAATRCQKFNLYSFPVVNDSQFAFTSKINEISTRNA
jgi:hypothetical protein